jgi:hypothetical protein
MKKNSPRDKKASMLTKGGILRKVAYIGCTMLFAGTILVGCQKEDGPLNDQANTPQISSDQYGEMVETQLQGTDLGHLEARITGVIEEFQQNAARDGWTDTQLRSLAARFAAQPPPSQAMIDQAMLDFFSLNTAEVKLFLAYLRDAMTLTYGQAGLDVSEYAAFEAQYDQATNQMADYAQLRYGRPFHHLMFQGLAQADLTAQLENFGNSSGWPQAIALCTQTQNTTCKPIRPSGLACTSWLLRKPRVCKSSNQCWGGVGRGIGMNGYRPFTPNAWTFHWTVSDLPCSGCLRTLPCSDVRLYLNPYWAAVYGMTTPPIATVSWLVSPS